MHLLFRLYACHIPSWMFNCHLCFYCKRGNSLDVEETHFPHSLRAFVFNLYVKKEHVTIGSLCPSIVDGICGFDSNFI